jgi:hypothetical protein
MNGFLNILGKEKKFTLFPPKRALLLIKLDEIKKHSKGK